MDFNLEEQLKLLKDEVRKANRRIRNHNKKHGTNISQIKIDFSTVSSANIESIRNTAKSIKFTTPKKSKKSTTNPNTTLTKKEVDSLRKQGYSDERISEFNDMKKRYNSKTGKRLRIPSEKMDFNSFSNFVDRVVGSQSSQEDAIFKENYIKALLTSLGSEAEPIIELLNELPTGYIRMKHFELDANKWLDIKVTYIESESGIAMRAENILRAMVEDASTQYPEIIGSIIERGDELSERIKFIEDSESSDRYEQGKTSPEVSNYTKTHKAVRNRNSGKIDTVANLLREQGFSEDYVADYVKRASKISGDRPRKKKS